jgi:FMN phosphatase YigB (HAD superfamily)
MKMILFDLGDTLEVIVNNRDVLLPGALETLQAIERLKDAQSKPPVIALVTNFGGLNAPPAQMAASRAEILQILDDLKIRRFFEPVAQRVTLSTEAGAEKPSKKIFQHVINKIPGLGFPDVLFVTEALTHVKAARKFKMQAVHFQGPGQTAGDVSKLTDLIPLVRNFLGSAP